MPRFELLDRIWRPRTEIGRRVKHKLMYGLSSEPPTMRMGKRRSF